MIFVFLLGIMFFSILFFLWSYGKKQEEKECDYMIILGAGLHGDRISSALKRRLDQGIPLLLHAPQMKVIVSGGMGKHETVSEAEAMMHYLCEHGIDAKRIIKEDASVSTYTNFLYTKKLLGSSCEIIVTTCDFHMYRSCRIAKRLGFIPYRNPAKSKGAKSIKYYVREVFCVIKNWFLNN